MNISPLGNFVSDGRRVELHRIKLMTQTNRRGGPFGRGVRVRGAYYGLEGGVAWQRRYINLLRGKFFDVRLPLHNSRRHG